VKELKLISFYLIILIFSIFLAIFYGAVKINFSTSIFSNEISFKILQIRCVEVLQAILAGAILSLCGGVLQKVLKNPLADPFILGISSGGSFAAALFVLLNFSSYFYFINFEKYFPLQSLVSILGCFLSFLIIIFFKNKIKSENKEYSYLIIGIILNSFFSALLMIIVAIADQSQLGQIHYWLIGSLQPISLVQILTLIIVCFPCILFILHKSFILNHLMFGDEFAKSLGVDACRIRNKLILVVCILIAIVVSISGAIGFIGLIVPHYIKKLHKTSLLEELILIMIFGSIILVIADLLSRIILPPSQLPIGIFTALIGAPSLALILLRENT
jgi:iron complex transport system permease protein